MATTQLLIQMIGLRRSGMYVCVYNTLTQTQNITQHKKKMQYWHFSNMDGPREY